MTFFFPFDPNDLHPADFRTELTIISGSHIACTDQYHQRARVANKEHAHVKCVFQNSQVI